MELTIKSAYHLHKEFEARKEGESSYGRLHNNTWKSIWKLKVPSAVRMFIWRACRDVLPAHLI